MSSIRQDIYKKFMVNSKLDIDILRRNYMLIYDMYRSNYFNFRIECILLEYNKTVEDYSLYELENIYREKYYKNNLKYMSIDTQKYKDAVVFIHTIMKCLRDGYTRENLDAMIPYQEIISQYVRTYRIFNNDILWTCHNCVVRANSIIWSNFKRGFVEYIKTVDKDTYEYFMDWQNGLFFNPELVAPRVFEDVIELDVLEIEPEFKVKSVKSTKSVKEVPVESIEEVSMDYKIDIVENIEGEKDERSIKPVSKGKRKSNKG